MSPVRHVLAPALALTAAPLAAAQDAAPTRAMQVEAAAQARADGEPGRARAILQGLLATSPQDPDLLRRLAMVEADDGRLEVAQATIDRAADLAPDDLDVALARAYILYWRGDRAGSRDAVAAIAARDPDYPELATLRSALMREEAADGVRLRSLTLGGGLSSITLRNGTSRTWNSQELVAAVDLSRRTTVALGVMREDRGVTDSRLSARIDQRIGDGSGYVAATVVPAPDFQEHWSLAAGGSVPLARGVAALVDLRVAEYDTGTITAVQPGLRVALGGDVSLTGQAINIFGGGEGHRLGGSLRLDYRREDRPSVFAIAASYPDAEADSIEQLRSAALGVTVPLSGPLALTAAGSYEDRASSYRRWSGNLALTYRFGPH